MPPLSTHFRFAALLLPSLGIVSNAGCFYLGTTAPDAFVSDREASFAQHHFKKENEPIDLSNFVRRVNFIAQPTDEPAWSFTCGYFCHLWLDVFFRENADRMVVKRPANMPDVELWKLVRKETEILNAPFVLDAGHLSLSSSDELVLPPGLAFVDLERCAHLFHEVVKQSQEWLAITNDSQLIDQDEYAVFLENASWLCMNQIQTPTE